MNLVKLTALMKENNILYAVAADLQSGEIETVGDKEKLKHDNLVKTLFGDMERIKALNDSLVIFNGL